MSVDKIKFKHDSTEAHVARLETHIDNLEHQINALRTDVQGLVEAWKSAALAVVFIKWIAGIAAAIAAIKFSWHQVFNR